MIREIKTYLLTCDKCKTTAIHHGDGVPKGWTVTTRELHDCGLTGYTRTERYHACARCAAQ